MSAYSNNVNRKQVEMKNVAVRWLTLFALAIALVVLTMTLSLPGEYQSQMPTMVSTPMPKEVQLTEKGLACASAVGLNVGDTLVLVLDGNPSTGYNWEVGFYTLGVIEPTGEPEYQSDSDLLGAGGTYTFRFLAVGKGESALRLMYRHPLEKDVPEAKICDLTVTVK
jgi:inhibitor of cysteine peptidase